MVYFGNIDDAPDNIEEIWFAVRSLKPYNPRPGVTYRHVPELSPSKELFLETQQKKKSCAFTKKWFDEVYTPNFLTQIENDKYAQSALATLLSAKHDVYVACYCRTFSLCHTSILKRIFEELKKK